MYSAGNHFGWLDWVVVGGTLLVSLLIGIYYSFKNHSNADLLVGGRKMRILPVAASVMVTYVSAITVLGFPAEVYSFGGQIFLLHAVSAIAFPISAYLFIPFYYKMRLTSINEYLEQRFRSKWVRWLASATFILQQTTLSGVILYAPSIALEAFLGLPVWISIVGIGLCGTIYTSIGGLKAVVVTDAFQFLMMVAGMVAIVAKGVIAAGGIAPAFKTAAENGRLNFIDTTFDPFQRHNFWNFMIGSGFYALMQPAVHQLQVQRYCSMPSIANARKVIIYSVPLKLLVMMMCLLTGISIFAVYAHCDPFKLGEISKVDQIVPYFVVNELASVPGMIGLFTACIFSAVLSSISSALNSLAAVTWEDFLSKTNYFKTMSPGGQANTSRAIGIFYGLVTMALAFGAQNLGAIYTATFAAVGATGGALFGIFLLGMFVPFANSVGACVGLLTGLFSMTTISVVAFIQKKDLIPLKTFVDQCPASMSMTLNDTNTTEFDFMDDLTTTFSTPLLMDGIDDGTWQWETIFKLSYLLYAFVGAVITIVVGILFSLLALIFVKSERRRPQKKYLHPIVQRMCRGCGKSSKASQGVLTTSSIIRVDPIDFKLQTNGNANIISVNEHVKQKINAIGTNISMDYFNNKNSGKNSKKVKNGVTNKGYDASEL